MEINLSLERILQALNGKCACSLDQSVLIKRIASLEKAGPEDLAIIVDRGDNSVFDAVSADKIKQSTAGLFLASSAVVPGKNYLIVPDALAAFDQIVRCVQEKDSIKHDLPDNVCIAQGAVVSPDATMGKNTYVGSLAFVGKQCVIGENVYIHPGAKILDHCVIGDNSIIHAGAVI